MKCAKGGLCVTLSLGSGIIFSTEETLVTLLSDPSRESICTLLALTRLKSSMLFGVTTTDASAAGSFSEPRWATTETSLEVEEQMRGKELRD